MAISIKTDEQIKIMRRSGEIVAKTHELLQKYIRAGVTTGELNKIAEEYILSIPAVPSFKGYNGFPASVCTSVNEEVIHGIPGSRKLRNGDIISVDVGAIFQGFHGDAARTYPVGNISPEAQRLIDVTKESFFEGIKFAKQGYHLNDISTAIQNHVEKNGYSVVRDYVGHGIGRQMHEPPQIPNYRGQSRGPRLLKGMALAIEPMVNIGTFEVKMLKDRWTIVTKDKSLSAHYENTILITDGEPELLTMYE